MSWEKTGGPAGTKRGITEATQRGTGKQRDLEWGTPHSEGSAAHSRPPSGDVRWAKVLVLQAAIREGTYRVPSEAVADSLLRFARCQYGATLGMYSA